MYIYWWCLFEYTDFKVNKSQLFKTFLEFYKIELEAVWGGAIAHCILVKTQYQHLNTQCTDWNKQWHDVTLLW